MITTSCYLMFVAQGNRINSFWVAFWMVAT